MESSRTTPQLKDKARYLLAEFKKIRVANKSTGEKRRDFKYYDDMTNILGDRECVVPTDFAESIDVSAGISSSTITRNSSSSNQAIDDIPAENVVWEEEDEGINGAEQTIHPLPPLTPNVNTGTKSVTNQSALSDIVTSMEKIWINRLSFLKSK